MNEIKRSLKVCEDCERHFCRKTINNGRIVDSEYKCEFDGRDFCDVVQYRHMDLSFDCPYKSEQSVVTQKIFRNKAICQKCGNYSGFVLFTEHKCALSSFDEKFTMEYLKNSRDELNVEHFTFFKTTKQNDEAYENEVPKNCPYLLEHMVMEDVEIRGELF